MSHAPRVRRGHRPRHGAAVVPLASNEAHGARSIAASVGNGAFSRAVLQRVTDWRRWASNDLTPMGALVSYDKHFPAAGEDALASAASCPKTFTYLERPHRADAVVGPADLRKTISKNRSLLSNVTAIAASEMVLAQGARTSGLHGGHVIGAQFFPDDADSYVYSNVAPQWGRFNTPAYVGLENAIRGWVADGHTFHVTAKLTYGPDLVIPVDTLNRNLARIGSPPVTGQATPLQVPRRIPVAWTLRARLVGSAPPPTWTASPAPAYQWGSPAKPGAAPLAPGLAQQFLAAGPNVAAGEVAEPGKAYVTRPAGKRQPNPAKPYLYAGTDSGSWTAKVRAVQWQPYVGRASTRDWAALVRNSFPETADELVEELPQAKADALERVIACNGEASDRVLALAAQALEPNDQMAWPQRQLAAFGTLNQLQGQITPRVRGAASRDELVLVGDDYVQGILAVLLPLEAEYARLQAEAAERARVERERAEVAERARVEREERERAEAAAQAAAARAQLGQAGAPVHPAPSLKRKDRDPVDDETQGNEKRAHTEPAPPTDLAITLTNPGQ